MKRLTDQFKAIQLNLMMIYYQGLISVSEFKNEFIIVRSIRLRLIKSIGVTYCPIYKFILLLIVVKNVYISYFMLTGAISTVSIMDELQHPKSLIHK